MSFSALTWFSRYIYHWNLHFLNNVIIIKTKILLPHAFDRSQLWLFCLGIFALLLPINFKSNFFRFLAYLMKVIPKTLRTH